MTKYFVVLLVYAITMAAVKADGLADFSNNLASDLGPLLSLFGENITRQYLSESTKFIDYFIFAMAPIGIISTITAVIRVCGHPSLRAFIGRAQEGDGTTEAELCTSTSADVCELFNKGGITRVLGRPDIIELVHIPRKPDDKNLKPDDMNLRLNLFTRYLEKKPKDCLWIEDPNRSKSIQYNGPDSDSSRSIEFAPKPNLSLNVGIKRQPDFVFYIVAAIGFILQAGIVVFAGAAAWLLGWNDTKHGSEASRNYAPGIFIVGTISLCLGVCSCAALIDKATHERYFHRKDDDRKDNTSIIYWLQPGPQVIGDQTFDSFAYSDAKKRLQIWTSSTKHSRKRYLAVFLATSLVLAGYIAQFIGLRGLNTWVSIAQLSITLIMSILRSLLRMQRLDEGDNLLQPPDKKNKQRKEWNNLVTGHELDWLAFEISGKNARDQKNYVWHITGEHAAAQPESDRQGMHNGYLFQSRVRLSNLTGNCSFDTMEANEYQHWKDERVKVRVKAKHLGAAISQAATILLREETIKEHIYLRVRVTESEASDQSERVVSIMMKPPTSPGQSWSVDSSQLEAILGLWLWSMTSRGGGREINAYPLSARCNLKIFRIVSAHYGSQGWDSSIDADMSLWLGSGNLQYQKLSLQVQEHGKYSLADSWLPVEKGKSPINSRDTMETSTNDDDGGRFFERAGGSLPQLQRFCGWNLVYDLLENDTAVEETRINVQGFYTISKENSLLDVCAQDLFIALLRSMQSLKVRKTNVMSILEFGGNVRIENPVITALAKCFTNNALATHSDAMSCVIPPLRPQLPSYDEKLLHMLIQAAITYRRDEEWESAESVLRWACEYYHRKSREDEGDDGCFATSLRELGELYRWACATVERRDFGTNGIEWMAYRFVNSISIVHLYESVAWRIRHEIQKPPRVEDQFARATRECRRRDALFYLCFMKPGYFNTAELGQCLPLAARNGWTEILSALLEMKANPNNKDEDGRSPASHCAELDQRLPLQRLIDMGADVDNTDNHDLTPLVHAVKNGRGEVVKLLLNAHGIDVNRRMYNGRNAMWFAAERNYLDIMEQLLENGIRINQGDDYKATPLFSAVKRGHLDSVRLLMERGASVDVIDCHWLTPLIWAIWGGYGDIAQLLLKVLEKKSQVSYSRHHVREAKVLLENDSNMSPLRNHSDGFFSTLDVRPSSLSTRNDSQYITFNPPYSEPPRLMIGISAINIKREAGRGIRWGTRDISASAFELTWTNNNNNLHSASAVWLEFGTNEHEFKGMDREGDAQLSN